MLRRAGLALLTMLLGPAIPAIGQPVPDGSPSANPPPPQSDYIKMNGEPNLPPGTDPNAPPPKKTKPPKKPPASPPGEPKPPEPH